MEVESINKLKFREESIFEDHDDHDDHEEHDDHDEHDDQNGHDDHGHAHGEFDAHIWLDPMNAKEMVHEIAHELGDLDPANKNKYAKFVVFHDAYQYFEERFETKAAGALTLNTD